VATFTLAERSYGPDVLGPQAQVPAEPLLVSRYPSASPPEALGPREMRRGAPLLHWFSGELELDGFEAYWFNSGELTLYCVQGPDNGPPLLLLPGQIDPWHSYLPILDTLKQHFRVIILEHRGHGLSERSAAGDYRVIDYTRDVIALIEHGIGDAAYLSGHSLGGMICLALWNLRPDLVRGLSLEDPPVFINEGTRYQDAWIDRVSFQPARIRGRAVQFDGLSLVRAQLYMAESPMTLPPATALPEPSQRRRFVDWLYHRKGLDSVFQLLPADDARYYKSSFERYVVSGQVGRAIEFLPLPLLEPREDAWRYTDWRTSISHLDGTWIDGWDQRGSLASVAVPSIFWLSDADIVPMRTAQDMVDLKSLLGGSPEPGEIRMVEGAGHYIHRETPALFSRAIETTFLRLDL